MIRVSVRSGDRRVVVQATGKPTATTLRAMERSARRLLDAIPAPPAPAPDSAPEAFGFALSSDIERAPDPGGEDYDEEDRTR